MGTESDPDSIRSLKFGGKQWIRNRIPSLSLWIRFRSQFFWLCPSLWYSDKIIDAWEGKIVLQ